MTKHQSPQTTCGPMRRLGVALVATVVALTACSGTTAVSVPADVGAAASTPVADATSTDASNSTTNDTANNDTDVATVSDAGSATAGDDSSVVATTASVDEVEVEESIVDDVVVDTSWLPCDETTFAGLDPTAVRERFGVQADAVSAWSGPQPLVIENYDSRVCGFFTMFGDELSTVSQDEVKVIVDVGSVSVGIEGTKELVEWTYEGNAEVRDITVGSRNAVLYVNSNLDWDSTMGIVFELPEGNVHLKSEFDEDDRSIATAEADLVALAETVVAYAP